MTLIDCKILIEFLFKEKMRWVVKSVGGSEGNGTDQSGCEISKWQGNQRLHAKFLAE